MSNSKPIYKRILLKLSGEALMGDGEAGIAPHVIERMAEEIGDVVRMGIQVGLVIGGGNLFRGAALARAGMNRVTGDNMGMLATVMNALAMQDTLDRMGTPARVMTAMPMGALSELFSRRQALKYLERGVVVIFAGGTGNPYFTTDSAASLRAIEIDAEVMIKATKVDGVYSADPVKDPSATRYQTLSYDEALERKLMVMDATAVVMCRDNGMPLRVFNMQAHGNLKKAMADADIGTTLK